MADDPKTHGFTTDSFLWASDRESSPVGEERKLECTADGELFVNVFASNTDATEDEATPAAIVGTPMMMERDDALSTLTPVEGDWAAARATAEGALWTQDFNSDAVLADTNAMVTDLAAMEALLTTIDADTSTVAGAVSGTEMQVDVVAPLPAGTNNIGDVDVLTVGGQTPTYGAGAVDAGTPRTTLASDDPAVALLGTIDADTGSIATSASTVAGAVSGSEMQVDIVTAPTLTTKEIRSGTAATTTPTVTTSTTTVLDSNANRLGALISNPTGGETVYINFGAAATTSHHELAAGQSMDVGTYTGAINGISGTSSQALAVTEFTA